MVVDVRVKCWVLSSLAVLCVWFVCQKKRRNQEALLILVEMLAFLFSQCCQWLAAGGILMLGID